MVVCDSKKNNKASLFAPSWRHLDVTVSEAGVVETSHVAAAILMIGLAVILYTQHHTDTYTWCDFLRFKRRKQNDDIKLTHMNIIMIYDMILVRAIEGFCILIVRRCCTISRMCHRRPIALRDEQTHTRSLAVTDRRTAVARDDWFVLYCAITLHFSSDQTQNLLHE